METSGPGLIRGVVGPLGRLAAGRDHPRPRTTKAFLRYVVPIGLLALAGLGVAAAVYLMDARGIDKYTAGLLGAGAVLPVVLMVRRPLIAWRLTFVMELVGGLHAKPSEVWVWNPVQIIAILLVLAVLAAAEESAVTAWATALTLLPLFAQARTGNAVGGAFLVVAVALAGNVVWRRRDAKRQVAAQAEVSERERARRAVLEERARIAREMHDVVAHHMSMIAVQAETAPYRITGLGEPATAELATIATAARAALTDMRRLLGVLRSDQDDTMLAPQPGLADVPALVETARRAGIPVTLEAGGLDVVPEAVGLAAYRIVQEALANAARHAPGGPVDVVARVAGQALELRIHNGPATSPVPAPGRGGHGLIGMRERATLLGGTLGAGGDDGGYTVSARLPWEDSS